MQMYKIKSNLSEAQVEADVAQYFGWISKGKPFRLLGINEQLTGADKEFFNSGFSFFIQFKKSEGLCPISSIPASNRKNRSFLEDIREFRDNHNLDDDPTLYFKLRKMAKNASDFQHNILMNYANTPTSQAFYVAPLHLDKNEYYNCLYDSKIRYLRSPFQYRHSKLFIDDWVSDIGFVPFLKEHVSIIPHERVDTHEHYYSYSSTGCDIGWHSPELLSNSPSRLSDLLAKELTKCVVENRLVNLENIYENIVLPEDIHFDKNPSFENEFTIDSIQEKGRLLNKHHKIHMFTFLTNDKFISKYREESILQNENYQ